MDSITSPQTPDSLKMNFILAEIAVHCRKTSILKGTLKVQVGTDSLISMTSLKNEDLRVPNWCVFVLTDSITSPQTPDSLKMNFLLAEIAVHSGFRIRTIPAGPDQGGPDGSVACAELDTLALTVDTTQVYARCRRCHMTCTPVLFAVLSPRAVLRLGQGVTEVRVNVALRDRGTGIPSKCIDFTVKFNRHE
nr:PREDICTED: uncharacterized protein LOC109034563 [Bemisia tabaci]